MTYAPDAGFAGTETILYTITDGFAFATATLTIEVAPDDRPTDPNVIVGAPFQRRIDGSDGVDAILIGSSRASCFSPATRCCPPSWRPGRSHG